jgi:hypothetical protein
MIGPQHRVAGTHSPDIESALEYTAAGQADLADPALGRQCGECFWFRRRAKQARTQGRCDLYSRRMQGRVGAALQRTQCACRQFREAKS